MKATIKFEDGREAVIELTPEQVNEIESKKEITYEDYCIGTGNVGFVVTCGWARYNPLHTLKSKEHAQLLVDRFNLEIRMFRWASEMNEGWIPDYNSETYWVLIFKYTDELSVLATTFNNSAVFGLAFKTEKIAEQAKEIFGGRILSLYGKQF